MPKWGEKERQLRGEGDEDHRDKGRQAAETERRKQRAQGDRRTVSHILITLIQFITKKNLLSILKMRCKLKY